MDRYDFVPLADYPGYSINRCGQVRSDARSFIRTNGKVMPIREKILTPNKMKGGYFRVHMKIDGEHHHVLIHRLVLKTFKPNPNGLPQCNHIDENKANNCVENLEWCDATYNNNFGKRQEKASKGLKEWRKENGRRVLQLTRDGVLIKEHPYLSAAAESMGSEKKKAGICSALKGRAPTAYGFVWRYKDAI